MDYVTRIEKGFWGAILTEILSLSFLSQVKSHTNVKCVESRSRSHQISLLTVESTQVESTINICALDVQVNHEY